MLVAPVSSADQIRKSLDARIEQLERELVALRAARAALSGGVAEVSSERAKVGESRHRRRAVLRGAMERGDVPQSVLRVFERWNEHGRRAQAPIAWQRARWLATLPGQARLLRDLPDLLDRSIVRQLVLDRPMTARGMFEAMVVVYAWGWSTTGVGVGRAQRALGAGVEGLGSALLAARDVMAMAGPVDGYAALAGPHRVAGLGPSFGSKFLYFVSGEERRALILDELMATWLAREAAVKLNATRWSLKTYAKYLAVMDAWSSELAVADHQLEEMLFTEEATRRGLPVWSEPP